MKLPRRVALASALALAAGLAGCAEFTPTRLHLLPPPPPPAQPSDALAEELIALNRLLLPQYADDPPMALLTPEGDALQSPDDIWADPLARAGAIVLARALGDRTGAPVMVEPFPVEAAPTLRVEVVVDRFITDPDGLTTLTGVYRVSDLRLNGLAIHSHFSVGVEGPVENYEDVAAAHSAALALLAEEIAASLDGRWGGGPKG